MTMSKSKVTSWNEAAAKNPMRYIASSKTNWEKKEFFASGEQAVEHYVIPFLNQQNFDPSNKRVLDIGCGVGRLTRSLSNLFGEAYGIDFSEGMISKARELNADKQNLYFQSNDGKSISFEDNYFDFCFSYLTLRHVKDRQTIKSYIVQIDRVLRSHGLFKVEVNGQKYGRVVPVPRVIHNMLLKTGVVEWYYKITRKDIIASKAIPGIWLSSNDVRRLFELTSLRIVGIAGQDTPSMWIWGIKLGDSQKI